MGVAAEVPGPFAGDELTQDEQITFFPWLGARDCPYIEGQRLSSCLLRRLAHNPEVTIIDIETDVDGVYFVFGAGPEALLRLEQ